MFRPSSKSALFLELAQPDKDGFSRDVFVTEFTGRYESLRFGNGGSWCREDSGLGKKYNINRIKYGNRITAVALHGKKKNPIGKQIPSSIKKELGNKSCRVLAISKVEIDHKDGHRDDSRLTDSEQLKQDDFQPLSKAVNNAKRQHCKRCRDTKERFDARQLGYRVGTFKGNGVYRGSCIGCYWHDPHEFNKQISAHFGKD